ncbi:FecR family protein [Roseibium aggregatum]|uniref:FecR domain-containing protein n=1 Tax=Roseibium aggregatum TaxID=187304 RepID=A0A939J652_9HYPH|nr:FecR domain-containing protein [Roseibium aggregatum]MBN9672434.1 FecR domain-containing protein [Roseibium aggregatum]
MTGENAYRHGDPVVDEALDWYLRLSDGVCDHELREFETWRDRKPEHKRAYLFIERMNGLGSLERASRATAEKIRNDDLPVRAHYLSRSGWKAWAGRAAALAAVLLISAYVFPNLRLYLQSDHMTGAGEQETVTLEDGSVVTLNTRSAIAIDFDEDRRQIQLLAGEVFFDVAHDQRRPFIVNSGFGKTKVLGTQFSVFHKDTEDEVVLKTGSLEVASQTGSAERSVLKSGEGLTVSKKDIGDVRQVDVEQALSWLKGRVEFRDTSYGAALASLERYYGGLIVNVSFDLETARVSGTFAISDPETAIRTLTVAAGGSTRQFPGGLLILN